MDKKIYPKYQLDELIIDKPLVSIYKYPLYYLLVLVDTLDFYKFYNRFQNELDLNTGNALDDVELEITDGTILTIRLNKEVFPRFERLINDTKEWLCLNASFKDESTIDIQFL